jgi:energy-coupling factor transport system ATP-binding protein
MIVVDKVSFRYSSDAPWALNNLSLQIDDGEYLAILGQNGAGKSTLVRLLNGLLHPTLGNVFVNGINTRKFSVAELSKEIGLVFQNPEHQLFAQTVKEELEFSLRTMEWTEEEKTASLEESLDQLNLSSMADRSPFKLSGGEKRRTSIGTIWVRKPSVLILDEPTTGQDATQKKNLARLITQLREYGKTILLVTHDIEFTAKYCPRVVIMKEGQVFGDGPASNVFSNRKIMETAGMMPPQLIRLAWKMQETFPSFPTPATPSDFAATLSSFLKDQHEGIDA